MGRIKAIFDYAKGYKGYKDALKKNQNKESRGINALQSAVMLNMVTQYREQYSATKLHYDTLKSIAENYEMSEDTALQEQAKDIFDNQLPLYMEEMLRYKDMMKDAEQQYKDREEAPYFDIDDIGDDEAMAELDEAEANLRSKDLSDDQKSFWERKREEILESREDFINRVDEHRESFDDKYNKCKDSIKGMNDQTKGIKDICASIKAIDINDPEAVSKLAELKAQLEQQQTDFDSHVESFRKSYEPMVREHNEFIDENGFSPFKKIKDTSLSGVKTFEERKAEMENPSFEENDLSLGDRFNMKKASIKNKFAEWKESRQQDREATADTFEDLESDSEEMMKPVPERLVEMSESKPLNLEEEVQVPFEDSEESASNEEISPIEETAEAKPYLPSDVPEEARERIENSFKERSAVNTNTKPKKPRKIAETAKVNAYVEEAKIKLAGGKHALKVENVGLHTDMTKEDMMATAMTGPIAMAAKTTGNLITDIKNGKSPKIAIVKDETQDEAKMEAVKSEETTVDTVEKSETVAAPEVETVPETEITAEADTPEVSAEEPEGTKRKLTREQRVAMAESKFGSLEQVVQAENSGLSMG